MTMNGNRPIWHRLANWWMVSSLAVATACAATRTSPVSDPAPTNAPDATSAPPASASPSASAPVTAVATPSTPAVSATASVRAPPEGVGKKPRFDVPYWPTPQPVVDKMLTLAEVKSTDVVYDLGCGDARSLVTAAQRYGAKGLGFEIDSRLVDKARENVRRNGVENLVQIE